MSRPAPWRPTREDPLLILAMDHRASFGKSLFGVHDDAPTAPQRAAMEHAKQLIYAGLRDALPRLPAGRGGVLVDQRYGQGVIDAVTADQTRRGPEDSAVVLAVPLERSGRDWFELEYDDRWLDRFRAAKAAYAKVLVRDNPAYPEARRREQFERLRSVSEALRGASIPLLYELLVPATDDQLASVAGSADDYDRDLRPDLVVRVIADNQVAGVEPVIWKIEGLETAEAARAIVTQIRSGGRDEVDAIVLGRDAPPERLEHWLDVAAEVDGFVGFAIGRSIWEDPTAARNAGTLDDAATSAAVAATYLRFADRYLAQKPKT